MKTVLIIQPTIPHYRVRFFNAIERLRPPEWRFAVTFDRSEFVKPRIIQQPLSAQDLRFPTEDVRHVAIRGKLTYQTVWRRAARYDLIIAEHALRDLAYPLCMLHRLHGARFAWWGHGRDRSIVDPRGAKRMAERVKRSLVRPAHGYFAYTESVKEELVGQGYRADRIFVLNNTIDIERQRAAFERYRLERDEIRRRLGIEGKRVVLFVGRLTENKRVPFLLEAFAELRKIMPDVHLLVVGGGDRRGMDGTPDTTWFGSVEELDRLAPIYAASDLFAFPGAVGLGPLQALCHDLPVVTVDSDLHGPEIEYLTPENALIMPRSTTAVTYAAALRDLLGNPDRLAPLRAGIWRSIRHLTIDEMARRFIEGVNVLVGNYH